MSADIERILQKVLSGVTGLPPVGQPLLKAISGGSINDTYQVLTKLNNRWFCKFNNARQFPDLFVKESRGLALLNQSRIIRVPATVACAQVEEVQVLLLEWIDQGPRTPAFWRIFGESLAHLHLVSTRSPLFGLNENNYMGALTQDNTPASSWVEFFIRRRLEPQIRLAVDNHLLDDKDHKHFQRLYQFLPEFFPPEPPSLLHGDLWNGNFLCDTTGKPVLIDPAVYFGHRSIDLAMTTLFGGFDQAFYEAYAHHYPFPSNYRQQWEICNLYPLLIHLNLFGRQTFVSLGNASARLYSNILHTIQRF